MPEEVLWDTFFDPSVVLTRLGVTPETQGVVEFGCGPICQAEADGALCQRRYSNHCGVGGILVIPLK